MRGVYFQFCNNLYKTHMLSTKISKELVNSGVSYTSMIRQGRLEIHIVLSNLNNDPQRQNPRSESLCCPCKCTYPYFEIDVEQDVMRKPLLIAQLNSRVRARSGASITIELKWNPIDARKFGSHATVRPPPHVTRREFRIQALARFGSKSHGHPDF